MWIDDDNYAIGQVGFLVKRERHERGMPVQHVLRERPPHTNQSHEPRLFGWCGTTDNVAVYGCGLARVVRIAANGRALVQRVEPTAEALDTLGYPDIAK